MEFDHFKELLGKDEHKNDVLHKPPLEGSSNTDHVIFFPGDIQNFEQKMSSHPQSKHHTAYSFENTLNILGAKFKKSHIWLVVPRKRIYNIISCYTNFVPTESVVCLPKHSRDHDGVANMAQLFQSMLKEAKIPDSETNNITLAAFSKGCVVLNQMLYEASRESTDEETSAFLGRIRSVYWLDGGHSGTEDDVHWVTDEEVLGNLTSIKHVQFVVHTSPYQTKDPHRRFKGEQLAGFVEVMKRNGCKLQHTEHFEEEVSLEVHFKVIDVFEPVVL